MVLPMVGKRVRVLLMVGKRGMVLPMVGKHLLTTPRVEFVVFKNFFTVLLKRFTFFLLTPLSTTQRCLGNLRDFCTCE